MDFRSVETLPVDQQNPLPAGSSRPVLLLVDDDVNVLLSLRQLLGQQFDLRAARGAAEAWRLARSEPPELILMDIEMPDIDGLTLCRQCKSDPLLSGVPVVFLTSHDDETHELQGLNAGASDFITKPPRGPVVAARIDNLVRMKRLTEQLQLEATSDGLTGLGNRRQFDRVLDTEWRRSVRAGTPLSLLMIDVDHFKAYNDHHGHVGGDRCLRTVAATLRQAIRLPADQAFRYGGEEFALLLPDTDRAGAETVAAAVRTALAGAGLVHGASAVSERVTVSVGVSAVDKASTAWHPWSRDDPAQMRGHHLPAADLLRAADAALYVAKASGRDRAALLAIEHAGQPSSARVLRPSKIPDAPTTARQRR